MDNRHDNEMEQIQRGLEDFLEKELGQTGKEAQAGQRRRAGTGQASVQEDVRSRDRGYLREEPDRDGDDFREDTGGDDYSKGSSYGRGRMYSREDAGSRERLRSREDADEYDRMYSREETGSREGMSYREDADEYDRMYSREEPGSRGRSRSREDADEYDRVYSHENSGDGREYPEDEEEENGVYDWDSRAPRRRTAGQDSGRPNDFARSDSRRDRDSVRIDFSQETGYARSGTGRDGNYTRPGAGQRRSHAAEDSVREMDYTRKNSPGRSRDSRGPDTADFYEDSVPAGRKARGGVRPQGRSASAGSAKSAKHAKPREEEPRMAGKEPDSGKARKKKRKKKHRLLKFLIAVALIFVLLGVGLYQLVGVVYGKMTYHEIASLAQAPMKEDGVVNILLIGNDSRENGEDGRSDAMILLSVSNKTKKIYMTSLLRDMYVDIPGHDGNRLNAAYSFGGAELLMETIEQNLDISVNRYVLVNFQAFANLVDAVGGIELDLTKEEKEYVNGYLVEYNILLDRPQGTDDIDASQSGPVQLNGPQALAYSRNRYLGTDFGRTDRQRKVLTAVIGKLPGALVTNPKGLMDGLLPNLTTNLTRGECFRLSLMAGKALTYDIESDSIPQPGTYRDVTIREMQVLEVDFGANTEYLKKKLYGE